MDKQKEQQILIRAIHSPYFTKTVLAKDVSSLITDPLYKEIANTVVRYYGTTNDLLTLDTLNMKLEQRLSLKASQKNVSLTDQVLDSIYQTNSQLINAKEDNSESLLNELESYIHTQLANQAILDEAAKGDNNISERVEKRLSNINEIKLTGTKYEPLDILKDLDRKATIYSQFGNKKIKSGLKPLDVLTGGGLEIGQIGLIAAPQGSGKAQPYSEPVMTPNGIKSMGSLKVGDYVYNRFGKSVKVTDIFEKGKLDVYEVTLQDGRTIRVNNDHLFSYFTSKGNLCTKSLRELIKSGIYRVDKRGHKSYRFALPIPVNPVQYPHVSIDYDPYTLGALLGDGCLTVPDKIYISADKNKEFILNNIVNKNNVLVGWKDNSAKNYTKAFVLKKPIGNHHRKYARLSDLNIPIKVAKHSSQKFIPQELMTSSINQRYQLLRGLFDTDGSALLRKYRNNTLAVEYSSTSFQLIKQVQKLLWSLGYICTLGIDKRIYAYGGHSYRLHVICNSNLKLAKLFTPNSTKFNNCIKANNHKRLKCADRLRIYRVKKLNYKESMRCIMVNDKEHLYLSGDYFVSHNTTFLTNLTYYYAMVAKQNVLHISLEELDTDQVLRFDRVITNSGIKEAFNPDGTIRDSYIQRVKHYYEAVNQNDNHGQIFFEKSTPLTMNVDDIRQMISTVEREKQTKVNVIILDYADLLKKNQYSDNEAQAGELLFQDLVKLAQETNTLIFTATQLNRTNGIADVKTMDNIEGSYRKKNTIAFGATLNATPEERKKGYIRLYLDKVRNNFGFDDDFLYLRYDKKSMRIHAESPEEQEDHKATINAQANVKTQNKIDKNASLADIINGAIKQ